MGLNLFAAVSEGTFGAAEHCLHLCPGSVSRRRRVPCSNASKGGFYVNINRTIARGSQNTKSRDLFFHFLGRLALKYMKRLLSKLPGTHYIMRPEKNNFFSTIIMKYKKSEATDLEAKVLGTGQF